MNEYRLRIPAISTAWTFIEAENEDAAIAEAVKKINSSTVDYSDKSAWEISRVYEPDIDELDAIGMGPACPKCGTPTDWLRCWNCGGDGGHDGYEEDPLWYDEGDIIPCCECHGKGGWFRCAECRECFDNLSDSGDENNGNE